MSGKEIAPARGRGFEERWVGLPNDQAVREALMRLRSLRLKLKAAPAPKMGRGPGV